MAVQESPNVVVHDPERANHLLMLEFGDREDFDDPQLEYRRLFSELLGTFMLVRSLPRAAGSCTEKGRSASRPRSSLPG